METLIKTDKDGLLFNPWDNRYSLKGKGKTQAEIENFFFDRVFEEIQEFSDEEKNLKLGIDPLSSQFVQFYIISGYSGNGKTTFINWFKRKVQSENYFFRIHNLIESADGLRQGQSLISACISSDLVELLKESLSIEFIYKNYESNSNLFLKYFDNERWNAICGFRELLFDSYIADYDIVKFINTLDFRQLLIIYFLEWIFRFKKEDEKKSYSFCFDNLDELKYEYLTQEVWKDFLDISSIMNGICLDEKLKINFDFAGKISFVLVFREANIAVTNSQLDDRIYPIVSKRRFILTKSARLILKRRLNIISNHNIIKENPLLYNIVKILRDERYTDIVYLPLFNYDYRKLLQAILKMTEVVYNEGKPSTLIDTTYEEYFNRIPKKAINGARGILIFSLIKYLREEEFLGKFAKLDDGKNNENGYCRSSRMILTAFSNFSYPDGSSADDNERLSKKPEAFSLLDAFHEISHVHDSHKYLYWIEQFFNILKSSWVHFVTVYNKPINKEKRLDFAKEKTMLAHYPYLTKEEEDHLDNIKLVINASGMIYLRYLIVHFEYFSCYNSCFSSRYNIKPLPLFQQLDYNYKLEKYNFEIVLEEVFKMVTVFKSNMENYFETTLSDKFSIEQYSNSCFTFRIKSETEKQFYLTRIIMTHIQYIENFRYYLWHDKEFNDKILDFNKDLSLKYKSKDEIQDYLVLIVQKYMSLFDDEFEYPLYKRKIEAFEEKLRILRKTGYNSKNWIWIEM